MKSDSIEMLPIYACIERILKKNLSFPIGLLKSIFMNGQMKRKIQNRRPKEIC